MDLGPTYENQKHILGGVSHDQFRQLERTYQQGVVGEDLYGLKVGKVEENALVADRDGNQLDAKLLYVHPAEIPFSAGYEGPVNYSGTGEKGHRKRSVNDGALLRVESSLEPDFDLEDARVLLIGDHNDKALEGKSIRVQQPAV